ncbi:hypothetical protein NDU88_002462 [Pleurodeles waltl]|uniref:Uncharacterized protein n=1 Tax=Pleurodeles waltl TaxID=8319 RepID=A0AAV7Q6P9_PLEWA|nr:hypothetical protein NDU88_002462 [Pleurodeles waltl]
MQCTPPPHPAGAAHLLPGSPRAQAHRLVLSRFHVGRRHSTTQRWSRPPPLLAGQNDPNAWHRVTSGGSFPMIPLEPGVAAIPLPVVSLLARAPQQANPRSGRVRRTVSCW